jgi:hypothetical protein
MNRTFAAGTALTVLGVVGYGLGVVAPYPGRSFSMTGLMVGLTLLAVADGGTGEADGNGDAGGPPPRDAATDGGITEPMHARDGVDSRGRSVASRRSTGVDHPDGDEPAGVVEPDGPSSGAGDRSGPRAADPERSRGPDATRRRRGDRRRGRDAGVYDP